MGRRDLSRGVGGGGWMSRNAPIIQEVKMHKSDDKTKQSLFDLLFATS